ncbi:MAG: hypothetical protein M1836_003878 [Candelina mexicana]|nr:MAG: hypothetical protein M1836_003878 [Candelina mexicana]
MPPKRMTANPIKPARYRPGKPIGPVSSSEEEEEDTEDEDDQADQPPPPPPPQPKATSFPSDSTRIASNLKKVDLNENRRRAAAEEAARIEKEKLARAQEEEGFVTEESEAESEVSSGEGEEASESEEEASSEEEAPRTLIRPTFIRKDKRVANGGPADGKAEEEKWREEEERRKAKADAVVQEQLEKDAAARAVGKKFWDDDEEGEAGQVDDTDGLDPEAERAAWKLRELKRVKREREAIELAEKEREEVERRRNLSKEERGAEDQEYIAQQKEEREGRGKMGYLQKYYHKGAFFQDDSKDQGLDRRDIMGSRYQDDVTNRELLPQYMQVRDMTRLGKKGRTRYKDLKSEDTGRWGVESDRRGAGPRDAGGMNDARFMPDSQRQGGGATGANASEIRERRPPTGLVHTKGTTDVMMIGSLIAHENVAETTADRIQDQDQDQGIEGEIAIETIAITGRGALLLLGVHMKMTNAGD